MSQVAEKIASEIAKQGPIPFRRFMELALYCPNHGFYEGKEDSIGPSGHYFTSVSVGSLLGELLAWQFAEWLVPELQSASGTGHVRLAEAGAHGGELARDILKWLRQMRPELFQALEYWIVEPSARRQEWQRAALGEFGTKVRWVSTLAGLERPAVLGASKMSGVIFCNELLDAMPVRRWGWEAQTRRWFEWGVSLEAGKFLWVRLDPGTAAPAFNIGAGLGLDLSWEQLSALCATLPDGFTIETNEAAQAWWQEAAGMLGGGRLVTLDYGLSAEELFAPERPAGTLRAYRRHKVSADLLADPGEQDLTAHVNFTQIRAAGEAAGLRTEALTSQEQFLGGVAARTFSGEARFGEWTPARTRQLRTLTHPEHLGRAFKVLVQARD